MTPKHWRTLARILALLAVIGISVFVFSIRDQTEKLSSLRYPGIFLIAFLAYATVILPAPGVAIVFAMGTRFNPLGIALAAGAGATLGEITGYLAGFSGQVVAERVNVYQRMSVWMQKNGGLTILLLSAIPNPFFDLAGAAAGALRMPLMKFLFWCWIGETVKMLAFALAGSSAIKIFS